LLHLYLILQADQRGKLVGRFDKGRRDIDAGDLASKAGRKVACRTAEPAADVKKTVALGSTGKLLARSTVAGNPRACKWSIGAKSSNVRPSGDFPAFFKAERINAQTSPLAQ
jgi:hypothetical protein